MTATKEDKARWARERNARLRTGVYQPTRGECLRKHGMSGTPEHRAWCGMMTRCYWSKPGDRNYALYRGAGVVVVERWHDFVNFFADMGAKPSPKHSLDRYPNPRGNYEPGNCRWATAKEQANGERLTVSEWARRLGISRSSLRDRLDAGWSIERALAMPAVRVRTRTQDGRFADA